MLNSITLLRLSIFLSVSVFAVPAWSQSQQEGVIETRILDFDPQAGVKSQHFYFIDFDNQTVGNSFVTGSTTIDLGVTQFELSSVRDNFAIQDVSFSGQESVSFSIFGSTASGVVVMPDIDYSFSITVYRNGRIDLSGCHDAYPAYLIQHNGLDIYSFSHEGFDLVELIGTCDQQVRVSR